MTHRLRYASLLVLALTAVASTTTPGQEVFPASSERIAATAPLPQDELNALLAPIALYPDQLLAQVLMASTYPLDVVSAARFVQQNPSLTGDALDQALQQENWDPSVLSLTAYPQVLAMMSDMLDWTERLGQAFLANQQQVMDTVQMLRSRAQAAGNLQSNPQQTVMEQDGAIDIEPAQPQYVYVPVYDPTVIYGAWQDQAYLPPYWYPPAIYGYPDLASGFAVGIFFGTACRVSYNHWGWAHPNWRGHDIDVDIRNNRFANRPQYTGLWRDGHWAHSQQRLQNFAYHGNGPQHAWPATATMQSHETFRTRQPAAVAAGIVPAPAQPQRLTHQLSSQPLVRPTQSQASTNWSPQPSRETSRVTQPQPITRWTPQPIRETSRMTQIHAVSAPTLQPRPYAIARNALQPQAPNRLAPAQPLQGTAHLPQPIARPMPPRPSAAPLPQRDARQPSFEQAFHRPAQASVRQGPSSPPSGQRMSQVRPPSRNAVVAGGRTETGHGS